VLATCEKRVSSRSNSSLIEGCAKYNDEPVLDGSIMHIISELKSAGLINKEERNSHRSCIS
jgi:hypothetical protein